MAAVPDVRERLDGRERRPPPSHPASRHAGFSRAEDSWTVIGFGVVWGLLFGAITNLWSWPFFAAGPDISYEPGLGAGETLRRYWNYYFLTSFGWDLLRSLCNAVIVALAGGPFLRALLRFQAKFSWEPVETRPP